MRIAKGQFFELAAPLTADDASLVLASIRRHLDDLYREAVADAHHGNVHGADVEQFLVAILESTHVEVTTAERLALRAGALLHDVGYMRFDKSWSADRREHIAASLDISEQVLSSADLFGQDEGLRLLVHHLVAHHDDTNYQYPSFRWEGNVKPAEFGSHTTALRLFEESLGEAKRGRLSFLLGILQEADALAGTGQKGAERTLQYSTTRGVEIFGAGNPVNAWCWEESAAGNVLLAAKRALIDTHTTEGRRAALEGYRVSESFVEALCHQHGKSFIPETFLPYYQNEVDESSPDKADLTLKRYTSWEAVEAALRNVTLLGDQSLRPYAESKIRLKRYPIEELYPLSTYVLRPRLSQLRRTHAELCSRYALSLFDLSGLVEYEANGEQYRQIPPLVERYYEPTLDRVISVLVDGLHRVSLARQSNQRELWVAEVSEISTQFPVVALPLSWEEVHEVDSVPGNAEKRKFRYPTLADFPDVSDLTSVGLTPSNYLYFFYRDLSGVGSSGIREPDAPERGK